LDLLWDRYPVPQNAFLVYNIAFHNVLNIFISSASDGKKKRKTTTKELCISKAQTQKTEQKIINTYDH